MNFNTLVTRLLAWAFPCTMYNPWGRILHAIFLTTGSVFSLGLILVTYNLLFHPLRQYPGPLLARVSGLWGFRLNLQGRRAHEIVKAHKKYGPVVRIAPNLLSFSDPKAVREIYMNKTFVKASGFYAALTEFEPHIAGKIEALFSQWKRLARSNKAIDIYPWAHMLGFDVIYHLMFGVDPESAKAGKESEVMPWLRAWRPTFNYKEMIPSLEQYGPCVPGKVGHNFRLVQTWKNYAMEIVRECRKTGTKTPFLSRVLDGVDDSLGRVLTDSELAEECMAGMFGGSGTTANTFVYTVWGVLRNPSIVKRLREELKEAFPDRTVMPDSVTCAQLPFLNAVISETLRRYPTITGILPREAVEDTTVSGAHIPKGTNVGTGNLTIHWNETEFPDPLCYNPDRWLTSNAPRHALVPFSVGPRKCIGMSLAELELRIWLAAFFRRFNATLDETMAEEDMEIYDSFSASPLGGKLLLWLEEAED
ncbi:hypothetical protein FE257_000242 [Aspergillus nanangensis]|uniref:Cytochrome P450 n=1 Tax=Aspergillus nanangensis TaxID=2582783 RepID=A0AAD4D0S4_ASPNN|nr:hypothetical protein FE257_000242 [Aspergillus nanangensis]